MATLTPAMTLTVFNLASDLYDYTAVANNYELIDGHDHSPGKGHQVGTAGLQAGAVTSTKIASQAIGTAQLANQAVGTAQLTTAIQNILTNTGLTFSQPSVSTTLAPGAYVLPLAGTTMTLPTAPPNGTVAFIQAGTDATGSNPVTVSAPVLMYGVGLPGVTSFKLGTPLAHVALRYIAGSSDWLVISGQQDTGWVPLTLTANTTAAGGPFYLPAGRLQGDAVTLRGVIQVVGNLTNAPMATLPVVLRAALGVNFPMVYFNGTLWDFITAGIQGGTGVVLAVGTGFTNGQLISLDGLNFARF